MINQHTAIEEHDVACAWIFDVDGVLTHPSEKKVTELKLFNQIIKRLQIGEPVILNTGRALNFILKEIIRPLELLIENKDLLNNLFAVGEKGGVSLLYADNKYSEHVDLSISVNKELQNEAKKITEKQFSDITFYDTTKKTMISIEMLDGFSVEEFKKRQTALNEKLLDLIRQYGQDKIYKIDPSRIATDIENNHVGKGLGVQKALKWLADKKIKPRQFITFGDSISDVAMAQELHDQGLPVEFVFVGEKEILADKQFKFPVIYTDKRCEAGTMEYLERFN